MTDPHLAPDLLASWAERRLPAADRETVEAHLADCPPCRHEASALAMDFRRDGRKRRLRRVTAPLASVAAVLLIVLLASPLGDESPTDVVVRPAGDPEGQALRALPIVGPIDGAVIEATLAPQFTWHADGPDALYRFTLADESGGQVWTATVPDTVLRLPDTISLLPGERYLWYVDVLLLDGQKATTGVHGFGVVR